MFSSLYNRFSLKQSLGTPANFVTIACENKICIIIHFSFPRIGVIDCIRLDVRIESTVLGTFISSNVNMFQHV